MKWLKTLVLLFLPSLAFSSGIYNPGSGSGGGGGGGSSALQITSSGVQITSPTASINFFSPDFSLGAVGSTSTIALNPATTDFIHNQTTPQSATFNVSSGTATNINTGNLKFSTKTNMMSYTDGISILSMPDTFTTYFGYDTAVVESGDTFNTAFGSNSQAFPNSGTFNTSIGTLSMGASLITGQQNNAVGYASLNKLTSGAFNNAMGGSSLANLTSGANNTAVGTIALGNSNGSNNTAVGFQADYQNLAGVSNVMIGWNVGNGTTTLTDDDVLGSSNTWIGSAASQGVPATTAINNSIAIGFFATVSASNTAQIGGIVGSGLEVNMHASSITADSSFFGSLTRNISSVSGNFTLASTSTVVLANATGGSLTVTLPTAVGIAGKVYTVKRTNSGANTVTVGTTSAQTIDGATTQVLVTQYTSIDVVSDGANWSIL